MKRKHKTQLSDKDKERIACRALADLKDQKALEEKYRGDMKALGYCLLSDTIAQKIRTLEEGACELIAAVETEIEKGPIHVDRAAEIRADLKKTDAIMESWEANLQPHCFGAKWREARDKIRKN